MLYRFSSLNNYVIQNLADGEIFFQDPTKFNDPFEFGQTSSPIENIEIIYEMQRQWDIDEIEDKPFHKRPIAFIKDKIDYAVFCATKIENRNSTYMWSRYGQIYEGICIGYDFEKYSKEELIFFENNKLEYHVIRDVDYVHDRPIVSFSNSKTAIMTADNVAWKKGIDWEIEREIRILTPTKDGQRTKTVKIPDDCLKEIIIGYKANTELSRQVIEIVNTKYPGISVLRAIPDDSRFAVNIHHFNT